MTTALAVRSGIPGAEWLTPANLDQGMKLADMMAGTALVPDHLKKKPEDCFPILVQALRWNMDPFAVAQATAVVRGKLCYEGKLVHAVLISMGAIDGRLSYEYSGSGQARKIVVTGTPKGGVPCSVEGTVAQWQTENGAWKRDPDTMLAYRGARVWARLYCPDAMLGVSTPDEIHEDEPKEAEVYGVRDVEPKPARRRVVEPEQQDQGHGQPQDQPEAAPSPKIPIEQVMETIADAVKKLGDKRAREVLAPAIAATGTKKAADCPADKRAGLIATMNELIELELLAMTHQGDGHEEGDQ